MRKGIIAAVWTSISVIAGCGGRMDVGPLFDAGADPVDSSVPVLDSGAAEGGGFDAGRADFGRCTADDECVAAPKGCCTPCLATAEQFEGVVAKHLFSFEKSKRCEGVGCPACAPLDFGYIAARCVAGRCQAFDVRKTPALSQCESPADCELRSGSRCCEHCGSDRFIAIRAGADATLRGMVCPVGGIDCDECAPQPPPSLRADCQNGVCAVKRF